ncbi:MAG: chromosome segregation protein SMC [Saccharofermentanales bacterium]|jgi:chromosome segregation protein
MHLKSLEIQGFKSFPERTVIEFHQGVTAIIGPNGSGKSNVTDAIRWVLGEQSVRTLRGSRMEDVIFTGTQSRRAMSYAEVSMVIDNQDRKLPIDYGELAVTRRLYRSGDSEYYLNKTLCRLKDITALFMDTGLGRDGYSIVGQGRIDDILSNRSEDRRRVFEEASGIVKFKTRKDEAERKLANTELNMLRINDVIDELTARIEPLAEQSAVAKRYLYLRDQLKERETNLLLDTINQHEQKRLEQSEELFQVTEDLRDENFKLDNLRERNSLLQTESQALEQALTEQRARFMELNQELSAAEGQLLRNQDRIKQLKLQITASESEQSELDRQLGVLDAELADKQTKAERLKLQARQYKDRLTAAENEMNAVLSVLDQQEKRLETQKAEYSSLQDKLFEQRGQLQQIRGQGTLLDSRRRSLKLELADLISDIDRSRIQQEEAETALSAVRQKLAGLATEAEESRNRLAAEQSGITSLDRQITADEQELHNSEYRRRTLQDLERNREGYVEPVRRIMQEASRDKLFAEGIRGTLADLIRVEQDYELAVEIALGHALQNIVTADEQTAARLIEWLKEKRYGRATFLPISNIRGRSLDLDILQTLHRQSGFIAVASDLVRCEEDLKAIVGSLLGRVVIAADLNAANIMARQIRFSCRIVTLAGDVINPGGSMTGGYNRQAASGMLSRTREIEQLGEKITNIETALAKKRTEHNKAELAATESARNLVVLDQQTTAVDRERLQAEAALNMIIAETARIEARREMLQIDLNQLNEQQKNSENEVASAEQAIANMEARIAELRELIAQTETSGREDRARRDDLRETVSDLRVSFRSVEESLQAALEVTARIETERQASLQRQQRRESDRTHLHAEIAALTTAVEQITSKILQIKDAGQKVSSEGGQLTKRKEKADAERSNLFTELEAASARGTALQTEIARIEARLGKTEMQLDEAKNRLWEEYELTAEQVGTDWQALTNRAETSREVAALRSELRGLGDVNVAAIEEYSQVSERCEFMIRQRDDIESAARDLKSVIEEITTAMKLQFSEHFQQININFSEVFTELFGGGTAELNLENDSDILNCGIEIKAQPPGKKLQNMMLLSGGERCLTAIALLFAILKLRPTPFCVLDEVEAALDDANVVRFTEYIRRYAADAQFILVTHRKGTMEAADRLYGVTMQEKGISRILSMKLGD